jgi:hypothetical protein
MQNRDMTRALSFGIERLLHLQWTPVLIASQHGSLAAAREGEIEIRLPAHRQRRARNHLGIDPSTPSTYQLMAIRLAATATMARRNRRCLMNDLEL